MLLPLLAIIGTGIGLFFLWIDKSTPPSLDYYSSDGHTSLGVCWLCIGWGFIIIWFIFLFLAFLNTDSTRQIIDQKIALTEQINKDRIDAVIPILEKYPELEKDIIKGINPNAFAVLGGIYPTLKSNESYNMEAKIVLDNITKIETLKNQKLDLEQRIYIYNKQLWLLN
jgi:hypothetical protein